MCDTGRGIIPVPPKMQNNFQKCAQLSEPNKYQTIGIISGHALIKIFSLILLSKSTYRIAAEFKTAASKTQNDPFMNVA